MLCKRLLWVFLISDYFNAWRSDQLMGRPPGKPDTRIVLQESLWPLREYIYINLSEYHFHRVGVGYCECSDFAAAFTEFENLAIPAD